MKFSDFSLSDKAKYESEDQESRSAQAQRGYRKISVNLKS